MEAALDWISGLSWTLVYVLAIAYGVRQRTYCIPGVCICLNYSWEMLAVLARVINHSLLNSGFVSQLLWLALDVGVLFTWLRYAPGSMQKKLGILFASIMTMAMATLWAGNWAETAFVINLIMSVMFLYRADNRVFCALPIAILKCLGTLPATILNGMLYRNIQILIIGGLCLIADLFYIYEVWTQHKTA